jgi:hypothetical protein
VRGALPFTAALLLLGCAAMAPVDDDGKRLKPLASYAADAFVPVNLYLNANEQLGTKRAKLVEYAAAQLRDSGAFARLDRGVQRWPITLQARYDVRENAGAGDSLVKVLGLLTLGLVPVHASQTHTLFAEVLAEPDSVGAVELTLTVSDRFSIYDVTDPLRGERAAVDALLERLMAEIAQRKLVPRWKAFKPETAPKKKKEPDGRPT